MAGYKHLNQWKLSLIMALCLAFSSGPGLYAQHELAGGGYGDMLYPYVHDYDQTLCYKIGVSYCPVSDQPTLDANQVLEILRKVDNITRGIPKIVYLVGWQYTGHDTGYPSFLEVNPVLMRETDDTPLESLRWLMREGKKYNTLVSLHVNFSDCYLDDNPLGPIYKNRDILVRETDGRHRQGYPWCEHMAYRASNYRNWYQGTFASEQMEPLFEMIPELAESGSLHPDAWYTTNNPYYQVDKYEDCKAMREMAIYVRERFNVDLTTEFDWGRPEGVDFVLYHPMIWHMAWNTSTPYDPMQIPSYFMTGGDAFFWGSDELSDYGRYFGYSATLEAEINEGPDEIPGGLKTFATRTLPWYFLNRHLRSGFSGDSASFTGNILVTYDEGMIIQQDGEYLMEREDLFLPALWRADKEIIAYSGNGYEERTWKLPDSWSGISRVDLYEITLEGLKLLQRERSVSARGSLSLSLHTDQGVLIVPSGKDPDMQKDHAPSGTVTFQGRDNKTHGDWKGAYGAEGYMVIGDGENIPEDVNITLLNGDLQTWKAESTDLEALQKDSGEHRIAAAMTHKLHQIAEIECEEERVVSLYFLDWRKGTRWNVVDVIDTGSRKVLHSFNLTDFDQGCYLKYRVSGKVAFRISNVWTQRYQKSSGTVLSGIFVDK